MIRPAALYNKARFSRDFASLGRVAAVLCGNAHIARTDLTDAELSALEEIENENDEMDKASAREAKRKAEFRAAKAKSAQTCPPCPEMSVGQIGQTAASEMSQGQDGRDGASAPNNRTTEQPNNRTTNLPTEQPKNNINRSDTDAVTRARSATGSDRGILNPYKMAGEEFFGGIHSTIQLCNSALGDGFWAKAIRQLGDARVLEELWRFICEVRAGEAVDNPGAVMSKRLKEMGVR